jgi:type IV pilus assembly protein PilZ
VTEKREHPRRVIEAEVAFQVDGGPRVVARCRDVSLGGMFIEATNGAPYGASVRLFFRLPGLKDEALIDSIVRWVKPLGMGVQFQRMGARETHALTLLLSGR